MAKTILTVLADASDRAAAKDILTQAGYHVIAEAENGAAAIEAFNTHKPDLILMDVQLPDMEGIEAYRAMSRIVYKPIILCSVIGQEAITMRAIRESSSIGRDERQVALALAPFDVDLVLKPFKADRLIKSVKKCILNFYDPFDEE